MYLVLLILKYLPFLFIPVKNKWGEQDEELRSLLHHRMESLFPRDINNHSVQRFCLILKPKLSCKVLDLWYNSGPGSLKSYSTQDLPLGFPKKAKPSKTNIMAPQINAVIFNLFRESNSFIGCSSKCPTFLSLLLSRWVISSVTLFIRSEVIRNHAFKSMYTKWTS